MRAYIPNNVPSPLKEAIQSLCDAGSSAATYLAEAICDAAEDSNPEQIADAIIAEAEAMRNEAIRFLNTIRENDPIDQLYIDAAQEHFANDDLEVDEKPIVSMGNDPGAFVAAWLWVPDDKLDPDAVKAAGGRICPGCHQMFIVKDGDETTCPKCGEDL